MVYNNSRSHHKDTNVVKPAINNVFASDGILARAIKSRNPLSHDVIDDTNATSYTNIGTIKIKLGCSNNNNDHWDDKDVEGEVLKSVEQGSNLLSLGADIAAERSYKKLEDDQIDTMAG